MKTLRNIGLSLLLFLNYSLAQNNGLQNRNMIMKDSNQVMTRYFYGEVKQELNPPYGFALYLDDTLYNGKSKHHINDTYNFMADHSFEYLIDVGDTLSFKIPEYICNEGEVKKQSLFGSSFFVRRNDLISIKKKK